MTSATLAYEPDDFSSTSQEPALQRRARAPKIPQGRKPEIV